MCLEPEDGGGFLSLCPWLFLPRLLATHTNDIPLVKQTGAPQKFLKNDKLTNGGCLLLAQVLSWPS